MKIELQAVLGGRLYERDPTTGECFTEVLLRKEGDTTHNGVGSIILLATIPGNKEPVFSTSKYYTVTISPNIAASFTITVGTPVMKDS
jgi:hypothetical protein